MSLVTFSYLLIHVLAVVVLIGGGIFHTWILDPVSEKVFSPQEAEKLKTTVGRLWGITGLACFIAILVSGILSTSRAGALNTQSLIHTTYGQLLVAKAILLTLGLIMFMMIGSLANGISSMMAADGPPPLEKVHASAKRIKMLANSLCVGGAVAIALAVAMRLHG